MTKDQGPAMASGVVVRAATDEDASAICRVGGRSFAETFAHSCSEADMAEYLATHYTPEIISNELKRANRHYLVATVDDAVVAFSSLDTTSDEDCVQSYPDRIELSRIYVDGAQHGRGVAKTLAETTLDLARSMGKKYIWLGVWEHNPKANRFYEKLGFSKVGEHTFTVGSDVQTDWIVLRAL
ncbi:acyl-CoA N-acyltransferase [Papiliotrema laurentii]|uniref:Acyl-CoA N-acyltransferase n=1 Tax=Papiliotrema laurentii TaxID=5418 RepID=A0AAD9FSP9_PAPLA|nr:acyl-CoA N-acyltransferase [Papiliotrema laurentii]